MKKSLVFKAKHIHNSQLYDGNLAMTAVQWMNEEEKKMLAFFCICWFIPGALYVYAHWIHVLNKIKHNAPEQTI